MMCEDNQTQVTTFILLGFQGLHNMKLLLFVLFLLFYIITMIGNLLIVALVTINDHLKNTPMFYFLKYLSLADMLLTISIVPVMLNVIIMDGMSVSVVGCIFQLYIFGISGFVQGFLLAVMSLDRYLANRHPLRYTVIMNPNVCLQLVTGCWFLITSLISSEFVIIGRLKFCGRNDIDHFLCDLLPIVELSTSDTSLLMPLDFTLTAIFLFLPFSFIVITYVLLFFIIIKIPSVTGRRKFFSTCSSHLILVCTYYGTLIVIYLTPSVEDSGTEYKVRTLLYIVVIPMVNPFIYSLRNQEIKAALKKSTSLFIAMGGMVRHQR